MSKSKIEFTPDEKVQVHEEGALKLMCSQFRSHEKGLPELIKNSSDANIRADVNPSESAIVVLFRDGSKSRDSAIGCLDFVGMTTADIENRFCKWADPEASGGSDVEGGHGNGGKCYMTQMFESHSYLHTLKNKRASKYGFVAGNFKPGYFPTHAEGRGYEVLNHEEEFNNALKPFGITFNDLPSLAPILFT